MSFTGILTIYMRMYREKKWNSIIDAPRCQMLIMPISASLFFYRNKHKTFQVQFIDESCSYLVTASSQTGTKCIKLTGRVTLIEYTHDLDARGREACDSESCSVSGNRGPTIQSSIASHSLQLRSAASSSVSMGPCSGRRKGTVSAGPMS